MSDTVQAVRNSKGTHILIDLLLFIFTHAVCFERDLSIYKTNVYRIKKQSFNSSSMLEYYMIDY